jgi:hypothetical protein
VTMEPAARAPDASKVADYTNSYADADYLARTDPLTMLLLGDAVRTALRAYDEDCVSAALKAGATWQEIGDALGTARQNAYRKYRHLTPDV